MDILILAERSTLNLEYTHKENEAETRRQNVINILKNNLNLSIKVNSQQKNENDLTKVGYVA